MKICLDIRVSTKGGTSTFIDNYVRELDEVQHDHNIHFVFNEGATPLNGKHPRVAAVPYRNRVLEFQWSQLGLARVLKRHKFDVYHSLKHVGPIFCRSKTVYRVPAVGQFIGNYPMHKLDHIYWNHVAGAAYRNADMLIAVSQYVADGLKEYVNIPEDRIVTINNGVDSLFRKLPSDEMDFELWQKHGIHEPFILCVGNLVPVKNFATAIKAYAILALGTKNLPQLVLAGGQRHPHFRELTDLVQKHKLQDHVKFVGYQSPHDLLHFYNAAKMLVHPSQHEGFSFTILEAMACGVPVVASASTSIPEAAGDAALYHDEPTDAEPLADNIQKLLDDSALCKTLSERALTRALEFTWKKCVTKTVAAYDRLG
jgi:glycosyltransferase involved in cell wall biosynthesis